MKKSTIIASIGAILITLNINTLLSLNATDKVKNAIEEKDSISQTYNNYETNNYYEDTNSEKIEELEEKIVQLETKEDKDEQVLIGVNQNGVVYQAPEIKEPWRGPKNYKCDRAAGYPAVCCYCGEIGEIHFNIKEWQDTQGTYHLTHVGCGQKYCDKIGVQPRVEETYKIK